MSKEETSTRVELAFTAALEAEGLLAAVDARHTYFVAVGVALAVIDIDCLRLPNAIVVPSYGAVAVLLAVGSAVGNDWSALLRAGIGGLALFTFYFLLAFLYPAGMGFGDVKLAGILGALLAYLSWAALLVGAFAAFLLGAIVGIVVIFTRGANRRTAIPFGPFMIAGVFTAIFAAEPLMHFYIGFKAGA